MNLVTQPKPSLNKKLNTNVKRIAVASLFTLVSGLLTPKAEAEELKVGDKAPSIELKDQTGGDFKLDARKGKWTVLFFYPKAGTPGCTKQACAFRDNIKKITEQNADVYGISADTVEAQAKFHKEHNLNFTLLADPENKAIKAYGAKMPMLSMSKRWTFIIDPDQKIRLIEKDVDPVLDSLRTAEKLKELQKSTPKTT